MSGERVSGRRKSEWSEESEEIGVIRLIGQLRQLGESFPKDDGGDNKKKNGERIGFRSPFAVSFYLSVHRNWYEALMMARLISLSSIISRGKPKVSAW